MQITLDIPDYTSLAKRAAKMDISLDVWKHRGPINVLVDSTGLKVFGEGEGKMRKHGNSSSRPLSRDVAIRAIRRCGRRRWKESAGYHRRSLSETAMYRMKCCFGDHLTNRLIQNQRSRMTLTPARFFTTSASSAFCGLAIPSAISAVFIPALSANICDWPLYSQALPVDGSFHPGDGDFVEMMNRGILKAQQGPVTAMSWNPPAASID